MTGGLAFLSPVERASVLDDAQARGYLVVPVEPSERGGLADALDEAIERALATRGAAMPGLLSAGGDPDAKMSDQLFRARKVGAKGICVSIVGASGDDEGDRATLAFLSEATRARPLVVVVEGGKRVEVEAEVEERGEEGEAQAVAQAEAEGEGQAEAEAEVEGEAMAQAEAPVQALEEENEPEPPPRAVEVAPTPEPPPAAPAKVPAEWRTWMLELTAMKGPQPLPALERLFTRAYVPLAQAIAGGLDDPRALHAHDDFQGTFARAYTEACPTFALTLRRPKMVLDAPDIAARIGRLHGARSVQLLLVDGMRYDLGALVRDRLVAALASRASLTDELLLWSALPTTTLRQLQTIARGTEALKAAPPYDDQDEPLRGRAARIMRRVRVGSRELYKLDLVESRLRDGSGRLLESLPALADDVAAVIAGHAEKLATRTLILVFGDHGFRLDRGGQARQGGASPDEVLVPCLALLVGDLH